MKGNVVPLVARENPSFEGYSGIFEQRRQASLCYKCADRYVPRHQCKKQLLMLEGGEEKLAYDDVPREEELVAEEAKDGAISLHALRGLVNIRTITMEGMARNQKLMVLLNSGSTNSFMGKETAKKLGCTAKRVQQHGR